MLGKSAAIGLALWLVMASGFIVRANDEPFFADEAYLPVLPETFGMVLAVQDDYLHILGEPLTEDGLEEVIVKINHAPVYDLLTGHTVHAENIREGTYIRVAYTPATTHEDSPPTADAAAVWLHYGEEGAAAFKAVVSENIQYYDDRCTFMTADGKYRVTLTENTLIMDADDGFYEPFDIRPGIAMFIWVDMVTASCPAQAYPDKVMLMEAYP